MKEKLAKTIRIISIPPIMVTVLILVLAINTTTVFTSPTEIVMSILFLGIVPVLAYPIQKAIPSLKDKGRDGQRKLAFVMNLLGYFVLFIWSIIENGSHDFKLITFTYFISVLLLTFCNKVLKIKASGHASSFTGPLLIMIDTVAWWLVFPCIAIAGLIIWASVYLKRHTIGQLCGGIAVCIISFFLSFIILKIA